MENLPEEVLAEILSWLPVESLVRFKCVCKSWYALFKNPKFVSHHMINHQTDDTAILLRYFLDKGTVFSFLSSVEDYGGNTLFSVDDLDLGFGSEFANQRLVMCGHWNGIVALSNFREEVILCNPATREFRFLPESCLLSSRRHNSSYMGPESSKLFTVTNAIGFGYDPKNDDYKVVRIVRFCSGDILLPSKAEVFSLYADSTWREVSDAVIELLLGHDLEQFFDGCYYWIARDLIKYQRVLVSFDMADEVFRKAPLPDICQEQFTARIATHIGALHKSIALFVKPYRQFETCIDLWVMKEFGSRVSWIKQLTIGPLIGLNTLLVFWKDDKELLSEDVNGRLISYNLDTLEPKNVPFSGGTAKCWGASTYRKTLVSVQARKGIAA